MRYAIAWLLGVPASIIVIWFVLGHLTNSSLVI